MVRQAWLLAGALIILAPGWFWPLTASALFFLNEPVSEQVLPNAELKIDSQGNIHLVFLDRDNSEIIYAQRLNNQWQTERVIIDGQGEQAQWVSLALDPLDNAHLAFYQSAVSQLKYARKTVGGWETRIIQDGLTDSSQCRIAVYNQEKIYILFNSSGEEGGLNGLYLASLDFPGAGGEVETVEAGIGVGYSPFMALSPEGQIHVSYYDRIAGKLKYAYKDNNGWQSVWVDNAILSGWQNALALDADGRPHIAYFDRAKKDLKYAYQNSSGWRRSTVDSAGDVGQYPGLGFDPRGRLLLAYYDADLGDLKIAYKGGAGWKRTAVVQAGDAGAGISMAVNDLGEGCLIFFETDSQTGNSKLYFGRVIFPRVYLNAPAGGEEWFSGQEQTISWRASSPEIYSYKLQYSTGLGWSTIVDNLPSSARSYPWQIPPQNSAKQCRLKLSAKASSGKIIASEQSPAFTILP